MDGRHAAASILVLVGLACMGYAVYRWVAFDGSVIPLLPVGLLCAAIGVTQFVRNRNGGD